MWDVTHTGKVNLPSAKAGAEATEDAVKAAKDGADVGRAPLADVPCCVDGIAGGGSAAMTKAAMQCRGCRSESNQLAFDRILSPTSLTGSLHFFPPFSFSADGDFMFSIQSGKKGATHLIKYAYQYSRIGIVGC